MHARDLDLFCDSYANGALRGACSLGFDLAPPDLAGPPRSTQERTCEIWNGDFWCNRHCKTSHVVLDGFGGQVWPKIGRVPPPPLRKPGPGLCKRLCLQRGGLCKRMCLHKSPLQAQALAQAPPRSGISAIQLHVEKHKKLLRRKLHSGIQKHIENQNFNLTK